MNNMKWICLVLASVCMLAASSTSSDIESNFDLALTYYPSNGTLLLDQFYFDSWGIELGDKEKNHLLHVNEQLSDFYFQDGILWQKKGSDNNQVFDERPMLLYLSDVYGDYNPDLVTAGIDEHGNVLSEIEVYDITSERKYNLPVYSKETGGGIELDYSLFPYNDQIGVCFFRRLRPYEYRKIYLGLLTDGKIEFTEIPYLSGAYTIDHISENEIFLNPVWIDNEKRDYSLIGGIDAYLISEYVFKRLTEAERQSVLSGPECAKVEHLKVKKQEKSGAFFLPDEYFDKMLYRVTFYTDKDSLLGPIRLFLDEETWEPVGYYYRE